MSEPLEVRPNPYESPHETPSSEASVPVFRRGRIARYLTRIVVLNGGVNLMGVLEFAAFFGLAIGGAFLAMDLPKNFRAPLGILSMCLGPLSVGAFDLWWRSGQPENERWVRLLSPYTGGCFCFVPIWLGLIIGFASIVVMVLVNR